MQQIELTKKLETARLKKFAQFARRNLIDQVATKLALMLAEGSPARRQSPEAIQKLEQKIERHGKNQVIEQVSYVWFNRFCALRFMDVNRYTRMGVVSPAEGQFQPEILAEAKLGHIDEKMIDGKIRQQISALLDGTSPSRDPQGEAYRLLIVAVCNDWNKVMPFLFQRIDDYTELLMPDDLLSGGSILAYIREAMTPDVCKDVEVIGWLYQFYISEKKDEVFAGLKKNRKITPENIPAATQLFTPHWIVRYLVENSLGRLWLLNRPDSKLFERMDYYIKPDQAETNFLRIAKPEEIRICDPACGSGHMLTYAFDLLYEIYEEEGYGTAEIPEKILANNLYGIEIDERAGELAAFALVMKARSRQHRFFNKGIRPNICVLENIRFDKSEMEDYMDFVGRDLFTVSLQTTLNQFEEADNFGSLIRPNVTDADGMLDIRESRGVYGDLVYRTAHEKVLSVLRQADYLSQKYHVVIANPPYMGSNGMNGRLKAWARDNFPNSKRDLFAMFIERNLDLVAERGLVAMITMQSWMFLSSFQALRMRILRQETILSMAHFGAKAFDNISGEVVTTTAFCIARQSMPKYKGAFLSLVDGTSESEKALAMYKAIKNLECAPFHLTSSDDFRKIPESPIAYWVSKAVLSLFQNNAFLSDKIEAREGFITGNNDLFLRRWCEIGIREIGFGTENDNDANKSKKRYFPCVKGGSYRRWSGNFEFVVNWLNDGQDLKAFEDPETGRIRSHTYNGDYAFRTGFTWSAISSEAFAVRHVPPGFMFESGGPMGFAKEISELLLYEAFLNSVVTNHMIKIVSPGLVFKLGYILNLPVLEVPPKNIANLTRSAVQLSDSDWNSYETAWGFASHPLLNLDCCQPTLNATYLSLRSRWKEMSLEMQRIEEENNRVFIEACGLQDELDPDVPLNEITLTCNPHYRYGSDKNEEELEKLLLADTMRELVSYAVGCMFGRYALDTPGLILANQGETIEDYLIRIPKPRFPAADNNVIPMLDGDWFADDMSERFHRFLRVAFGEEHCDENLRFVEKALNIRNRRNYSIRDYFLGEFYSDHVKRYKKRPIYWLFSSPGGNFNALVYMHRYRPDTVSVVLNDYLREFHAKLASHKNHLEAVNISASSSSEKTKALKEAEKIRKTIGEMEEYERGVLYPLATRQIEIDLDDGVKANYPKFGNALKKIPGLSAQ